MKVTIITVCYNSEKYIKTAIESVLSQDYTNIEYIIIDGNSNDNTKKIIKSYEKNITKFISEPDKGIYDAMNKGILNASGDIIGFLNSDDLFVDSKVISTIVNVLNNNKYDIAYGDLYYVKKNNINSIIRKWKTDKYLPDSFKKGWHPAHPTFYVKNKIYKKYGVFDINFKLAADFELMLRFLEKYKISNIYIDKPLIKMRLGGATNNSIINIYKQNTECYKAFKKNKLEISYLYPFYRLIPKITQFIK